VPLFFGVRFDNNATGELQQKLAQTDQEAAEYERWEHLDLRRKELHEEEESLKGAIGEFDTDIRILTTMNQVN
jgi:hypothetical protein